MNDRYQVFISSTYQDLHRQRRLIAEAVQVKGLYAAGMELFPASDQGAWGHIEKSIQESDLYLLIIAGRYGSQKPNTEISYTELEYELALELAESKGLRMAVLIWDRSRGVEYVENFDSESCDEFDKQKSFRSRLEHDMGGSASYFYDDASLVSRTHAALDEFIRHAGPGWVRARLSKSRILFCRYCLNSIPYDFLKRKISKKTGSLAPICFTTELIINGLGKINYS